MLILLPAEQRQLKPRRLLSGCLLGGLAKRWRGSRRRRPAHREQNGFRFRGGSVGCFQRACTSGSGEILRGCVTPTAVVWKVERGSPVGGERSAVALAAAGPGVGREGAARGRAEFWTSSARGCGEKPENGNGHK